jgi:hypothetical protein
MATIPPPGWNNADDLDRMVEVLNRGEKVVLQRASRDDIDAAQQAWDEVARRPTAAQQVSTIMEAVADDPTGATYSAKLNAGVDAEHDYTTGLIELSLAELQAFRAILALRRRT